jgi:cellobiose phosphorylase
MITTPRNFPCRLESPSGLSLQVNANGSIRRMDHRDIMLNLFLGTEMEGGPANIYLRRLDGAVRSTPLLGPRSPGAIRFDANGLTIYGEWDGLRFRLALVLVQGTPAWLWHVELENADSSTATVDLIYAQDIGLAHYGAVRMNEYYVSHYVDLTPLTHGRAGIVLAARQNLSMGGRCPWALIGSLGSGASFATDAVQFHGLATRANAVADGLRADMLPGKRRQHEHSMAVIQDARRQLAPRESTRSGFFGWFEEDHPAASSPADLAFVDRVLALPEVKAAPAATTRAAGSRISPTLFSTGSTLECLELTDAELDDRFGSTRRNIEHDDDGRLLSFFTGGDSHVVLQAKELRVLRPHGHLMRSGAHLVPDEASLTSTAWMAGVFTSQVTQGHVNINRLLSTTRSYLGLFRAGGQRVFVELDGGYRLLDLPSAFEIRPNGCRWIYKHPAGLIEVRAWAPADRHELNVALEIAAGDPCRLLISHHVAINDDDGADPRPVRWARDGNTVVIRPTPDSDVGRRFPQGFFRLEATDGTSIGRVGGDEPLFADGRSRGGPFLTLLTAKTTSVRLRITGRLIASNESQPDQRSFVVRRAQGERSKWAGPTDDETGRWFWDGLLGPFVLRPAASGAAADGIGQLQEFIPWLAHNAMVHYLAPRGLEQFSGGGWGTRDVCQGPVELLLALGKWEPLRDLLLRVFRNHNADGDWPQWFMFFERERNIRPAESHGDIIFWPLLALAQYLAASEDASVLEEVVPFFRPQGDEHAQTATVWRHAELALKVIAERVVPGTHLPVYGHGDWNDSLQPVDPALGTRLCSAWTATLYYQVLMALAEALARIGHAQDVDRLRAQALRVAEDFRRLLIVDGTIAGYAHFLEDGRIEYLLHPSDRTTGVRFSLLPMMHAIINGMLPPEEAETHLGIIGTHLLGADGARLFDRPFDYRGGPQRYFQRAESSAFFGREVGLMYMHAHLRYAEMLARCGEGAALFRALLQATPCGLRAVVPDARSRQANCYYSSSDAAFHDRYEARGSYEQVKIGAIGFEGGWRIYSSGAGILLRLIRECFFGLGLGQSALTIDPVLPPELDGLCIETELVGRPVRLRYRIAALGRGPTRLLLNATELSFERVANPYRTGGARVSTTELAALLAVTDNTLEVYLE